MTATRFPLGRLLATPAAAAALRDAGRSPLALIRRHQQGDWGAVDAHDRRANDWAVAHGARILSVYPLPDGATVWIITEADRASTTILLPEDY